MMKTTGRTNKMSKRFLALGLTLSLIFGMTLTAYASEEGEGGGTTPEVTAPTASENQTPAEPSAAVQEIADVQEIAQEAYDDNGNVTAETMQGTGAGLVDNAEVAVFEIIPENERTRDIIIESLVNAENDVTETDQHLENAKGMVDDANAQILEPLAEVKKLSKEATAELQEEYVTEDTETREDAQSAINNARIANTIDSEAKAYAAKDAAVADLANAETGLLEATAVYDDANTKVEKAQKIYNGIIAKQETLKAKLDKLQNELAAAKGSSANALSEMKKVQDNLWDLNKEAAQKAEELEELQGIRDQYYAMMVQYYNTALGDKVVYEDGKLDIEANIKKITDKQIDKMAAGPGNFTMELGRNLLKQLVTYMFKNDVRVDGEYIKPDSIVFGIEGTGVKATEGIVVSTSDGQKVEAGTTEQFKKINSNQSDNGRTNRFKVKYTNANGEEIVKCYNYIFKTAEEVKANGLDNGMIYLALIEEKENEDGSTTWVANQVESDNNYDNYKKLEARLAALQKAINADADLQAKVAQYQAAKNAVDAATARVKDLDDQVAKLKNKYKNTFNKELQNAEKELKKAQDALEVATEQKEAMEAKVEEARRAVAGINLNRFNVAPEDDGDETTGATPDSPTIASITPGVIITPVFPAGAAATTVATGVAGAATGAPAADAGIADLGEAELPGAATPELTELEDDLLPAAAEALTNLGDKDLPGAEGVEEGMSLWWIWLLILLLLIVAYLIYRDQQKKKEAQQNNNINPTV